MLNADPYRYPLYFTLLLGWGMGAISRLSMAGAFQGAWSGALEMPEGNLKCVFQTLNIWHFYLHSLSFTYIHYH